MLFKKLILSFSLIFLLGLEVVVKSGNVSPLIFQLFFNKNNIELKKSAPNTVNILLLGRGGGR